MSVGEYIVDNLRQDELKSENPLHNLILELYEQEMKQPGFSARKFFVAHVNPEVSRLASDLVAREYTLSKIHKRIKEIKKDEELLEELVPRIVLELKWKIAHCFISRIASLAGSLGRDALRAMSDNGNF